MWLVITSMTMLNPAGSMKFIRKTVFTFTKYVPKPIWGIFHIVAMQCLKQAKFTATWMVVRIAVPIVIRASDTATRLRYCARSRVVHLPVFVG